VTESSLVLNTAILSELTAPTSDSIHISTILLESRRFGVIEMQEKKIQTTLIPRRNPTGELTALPQTTAGREES